MDQDIWGHSVLPRWKLEASCSSGFLEGSGLGGRELKLAFVAFKLSFLVLELFLDMEDCMLCTENICIY